MPNLAQQPMVPLSEYKQELTDEELKTLWFEAPMWKQVETEKTKQLQRTFEFDSFAEAVSFAARIGGLVEDTQYVPTLLIHDKTVTVNWTVQSIYGLHVNDFIMAARTDQGYLQWLEAMRKKKDPVQISSEGSFPASDPPGWIGKDANKTE